MAIKTRGRRIPRIMFNPADPTSAGLRGGRTAIPVKVAAISTPFRAVGAALLRTPLARSALRRVPGIKNLVPGSAARIKQGELALGLKPVGVLPAALPSVPPIVIQIGKGLFKTAAVAGGFALGEEIITRSLQAQQSLTPTSVKSPQGPIGRTFPPAQFLTAPPKAIGGPTMAAPRGLQVGQLLPPSDQIVKTWQTFPGGPVFARMADGHQAVQKKDGTIKHYRPYRPVVIPKKWDAKAMRRVATALKRQRKTATKIMQLTGGLPKKR